MRPLCASGDDGAVQREILALIQQLQVELKDMTARYKIADDCAKKKGEMNEKLYAELTAVKAERGALMEYLTNSHFVPCDICKHDNGEGVMGCKRARELKGPCFEWRGVQKEE